MFAFINRKREFQTLQESFLDHVIKERGCLSYLIQGRLGAGKTRLIYEFINTIESDKRIASRIPKFRRRIHVIEYECKKELSGPYLAFVEISKQIQEQQQTFRILKQLGMLAIAFLPIHDIIEDFLKLGSAINSGETEEAIRAKETKLFTKYLKTLKRRSESVPLIIYIKNVQWIDDHSLELLHTLIDSEKSMWGMIILEQDEVGAVNHKLNTILNKLIDREKLFRLMLRSMQKGFEMDMLESRFGQQLFTTTEYEHIYTISEGCPGLLAAYSEDWIRKEWIYQIEDQWCKVDGFENKIKAPHQKLLDLLITLLQDGVISSRERILINNFAEEWGIGAQVVSRMTDMLLKAQELGYTVERRVHSGAVGKDAFLAYDDNMNRYLVEYVSDIENLDHELVPREVKHPHLLGTKEIKQFQDGVLIVSDYIEGKTLKELKIEAYDSHIKNTLKTAAQMAEGLAELHRNKLVHGHLRPESILVTEEGDVRLTGLDAVQFKQFEYPTDDEDIYVLSYLSPEHINQEDVDARSDIFSFGILLYEMLTGELPFQGKNKGELKQAIRFDAIPPFEHIKARIPHEIQNLIAKCLHKNPDQRFQNAGQLVKEIQELIFRSKEFETDEGERSPAKSKADWAHKRSPRKKRVLVPAFVSLLGLVAVAVVGYFLFFADKFNRNIVDRIVFRDIEMESGGPTSRLTPSMLKYLIIDDLMQASDVVVLEPQEFAYLHPNDEIPRLQIDGVIRSKGVGYEITLQVTPKGEKPKKITLDFVDPAALLVSEMSSVTSQILGLLEIDKKKKSTFTANWDAFESFYDGEKAWDKLETTTAEQKYTQALEIDPNFVLAKLRLAGVLRFTGSTVRAKQLVESIRPHLGELSFVDSLKAEALTARLNGQLIEEINILKKIYEEFSTRKEAPYEVAEAYYTICDIKNAIYYYNEALKLDINFARARNHLGYCYSHRGDHAKALQEFRTYVKLDTTANAYDSLGDGLMAAGKLDSAVWAKETGIRLDPKLSYLYGALCYIQLRQGKFKAAEESAKKYLAHSPDKESRSNGYFLLALVEYCRKNYAAALTHAFAGKKIYDSQNLVTRNHELHWLLGLLYLETAQEDSAAVELAQMSAIIDSNKINATNYRMGVYKYAGHLKACLAARRGDIGPILESIKEFDGAIKDKVKDHESPFDLAFFNTFFGEILMSPPFNQMNLAQERFEKALAYNPNYALAFYNLWKLHAAVGDTEKSNQALTTLKTLWKDADAEAAELYGIPADPNI